MYWRLEQKNKDEWPVYEFIREFDSEDPHNPPADMAGITKDSNDNQSEIVSKAELRFVLKILRHCAEEYSINLDENGWANVDDLILVVNYQFQIQSHWKDWNRSAVETICDLQSDRLEMKNGKIRARYGHSIAHVKVAGIGVPPRRLFHGTSSIALPWILQGGLQPAGRNFVHLTSDLQYAQSISETITAPAKAVILEIDTVLSRKLGIIFHRANRHVWLALWLPPPAISKADGIRGQSNWS